ncbi:hypothetical protein D0962_21130 [Leptolyngbyaceae cyanobacterium CCMR0082]|uniref:Uncharacterized protein n=1 Tax=Adonisia turfae CCMR0082 TaxID=2304604 RepID=A0A6M0S9R4_9CYAN|nr:hypothetical protein [Adonisia turfae]NEZ65248.1 hypothetical protein [Adonisia turfae CCMR0082]
MVLDNRFSSAEFSKLGLNSKISRKRADLLSKEIEQRISKKIRSKVQAIVCQLNSVGHSISFCEEDNNCYMYEQNVDSPDAKEIKGLRIAVDYMVSTGYSHLVDNNPEN